MQEPANHNWKQVIDKYYPAGSKLRDIFLKHSSDVTQLALELNNRFRCPLNPSEVQEAAMLHDIGIFLTHAPAIECSGKEPYIRHGVLGHDLLIAEGFSPSIANVCRCHTGVGITPADIAQQKLPLDPAIDYRPHTPLEKLVCYADKFFSKSGDGKRKTFDTVAESMKRFGNDNYSRFLELHREITGLFRSEKHPSC